MSTSEKPSLRILFIGTGVVLLAMGVRATFGLFMQPMDLAHGWGREVFSMAFALQNLVWGAACIGMGILPTATDRAAPSCWAPCCMRWA